MPRFLLVAPSWIGDMVMAQPLISRLHERTPGLELHALAPPWVAPLLEHMPEVARILASPFRHGELGLRDRLGLARGLRHGGYDRAIVLPNSLKSALVAFLAGIPVRTGFVGEMRRGILNDARRLDKQRYPLMVERFALLAEARNAPLERPVPRPQLLVTNQQQRLTCARFGLDPRAPVAVLCPGAEYGPAKRWPARYFAELAGGLRDRGYEVWVLGSPKEASLGEEIAASSGGACLNLCGRTSLSDAIELMACAAIVVTNDSGLMHVAAALDRPIVAIYGSSSPGFTPPLSERAQIVKLEMECSPCFKRECPLGHFNCMLQLTPERVLDRIFPS
jgi:lipopolysaccharide heptosyltransferase II